MICFKTFFVLLLGYRSFGQKGKQWNSSSDHKSLLQAVLY